MKCDLCGTKNNEHASVCANCGYRLTNAQTKADETVEFVEYEFVDNEQPSSDRPTNRDKHITCPNCGHGSIHFITREVGDDYDATNACCGFLLFGPLGLLCGLATNKETETIRKCMNCNYEF